MIPGRSPLTLIPQAFLLAGTQFERIPATNEVIPANSEKSQKWDRMSSDDVEREADHVVSPANKKSGGCCIVLGEHVPY